VASSKSATYPGHRVLRARRGRARCPSRSGSSRCARRCSVHRYYDPSTGQFFAVDPDVTQTGQPYGYAEDNPVNLIDPSGDAPWLSLAGAARAAASMVYNLSQLFGGGPPPGGLGLPTNPPPAQVRPVRPSQPQSSGQGTGSGSKGGRGNSPNGSGNSANNQEGSGTVNPCITSFRSGPTIDLVDCGAPDPLDPGDSDGGGDGESPPWWEIFGLPALVTGPCGARSFEVL
jgi:uncharacterized protein RhaS with RHS repeats